MFLSKVGWFFVKFAYARVFTRKQSRDGNGLEEQIEKLKAEGYNELVVEEFTGSTTNRPRIARYTAQGSALIDDLLNKGVVVHILNIGRIDNTPTDKLITNILLAFAEYERDMIIERTQAGKEIARTKEGFRDGRPSIDPKRKAFAADLILNQHYSYKQAERLTGLSVSTIARAVWAIRSEKILSQNDQ